MGAKGLGHNLFTPPFDGHRADDFIDDFSFSSVRWVRDYFPFHDSSTPILLAVCG
jgi:hypothetical protein